MSASPLYTLYAPSYTPYNYRSQGYGWQSPAAELVFRAMVDLSQGRPIHYRRILCLVWRIWHKWVGDWNTPSSRLCTYRSPCTEAFRRGNLLKMSVLAVLTCLSMASDVFMPRRPISWLMLVSALLVRMRDPRLTYRLHAAPAMEVHSPLQPHRMDFRWIH